MKTTTTTKKETTPAKQTVRRYKANVLGHNTVMMPKDAVITHARFGSTVKKDALSIEIYALCAVGAEDDVRTFVMAPTGEEVPHPGEARFVQTASLPGLPAVHVFELL